MSPLFCLVDRYLASLTFRSFRLNCKVLIFVTYHISRLPDIPSVCLWLLLSPCNPPVAPLHLSSLYLSPLPMAGSFLISLLVSFPHPCSSALTFTYSMIFTLLFLEIFVQRKQSLTPAIIHSSCRKGGKLWHFSLACISSIITTVIIIVASSLAVGTSYSIAEIKHVCLKLFLSLYFLFALQFSLCLSFINFALCCEALFFCFVEYALLFATLISIGGVSDIRAGQLLNVTADIMLVF